MKLGTLEAIPLIVRMRYSSKLREVHKSIFPTAFCGRLYYILQVAFYVHTLMKWFPGVFAAAK